MNNADICKNSINVLHLSDVHFGVHDLESNQYRLLDELIKNIEKQDHRIDYCLFTGDLANSAEHEQYEKAELWLDRIYQAIDNPNAKMMICPGNHDVCQDARKEHIFKGASIDEDTFNGYINYKVGYVNHVERFLDWHNQFSSKRDWVISSWENNVNLIHERSTGLEVNFILANSAILSNSSNDYGRLCADINGLNLCLSKCNHEKQINIFAMHHPLNNGWFTSWNETQLKKLLGQKQGAHLCLTGHIHDAEGSTSSNNYGSNLTTLGAGAAYTEGEWKKSFSFYQIDFNNSIIKPIVYEWHDDSGNWLQDNKSSFEIPARLPNLIEFDAKNLPTVNTRNNTEVNSTNFFSFEYGNEANTILEVCPSIFYNGEQTLDNIYQQFDTVLWLPSKEAIEQTPLTQSIVGIAFCFKSLDFISTKITENLTDDDINGLLKNRFKRIPISIKQKLVKLLRSLTNEGFIVSASLPIVLYSTDNQKNKVSNTINGLINTILKSVFITKSTVGIPKVDVHVNRLSTLNNGVEKRIKHLKEDLEYASELSIKFYDEQYVILEKLMGLLAWFISQEHDPVNSNWMKLIRSN